MKNQAYSKRKMRYASTSIVLTALIIAAILVVNIIFSALASKFLWYIDLTPEPLFTLSDECFDLIENGDDAFKNSSSPIEMVERFRTENAAFNKENGLEKGDPLWRDENLMIEIIFCDDIDSIEAVQTQRYVYHTALELQDKFPEYIRVVNYNVAKNPSAVTQYQETSLDVVNTTSVIVACGTEYRKYSLRSFYTFDTATSDEPWAYNAEKKFAAGILAVTRTETPVACITTNHGETISSESFLTTLEDAGYAVRFIDLATEEIPVECRLIIVCNPMADFMVNDGVSQIDEIEKLDAFLDNTNSLMVFMSPSTPRLTNFEDYLEEWGVVFNRYTDELTAQTHSMLITDKSQSLTTDGYTIVSEYATAGAGASLTSEMRSGAIPKKVIFKNAMPISYAPTYSLNHYSSNDSSAVSYDFGHYSFDGTVRKMFDVFLSSENATAYANGGEVARATEANPFKLMTVTVEERITQESTNIDTYINEASYVVACGSVDFLEEALVASEAYGNGDLVLSIGRAIGQEPVPVGLAPKPFADSTIDVITAAEATQYTVTLTVLPAICALAVGIVVLVRRKNR